MTVTVIVIMRSTDLLSFALAALVRQKLRGVMLLLAIGISVASVVVMTALGQGAKNFVDNEFAFLGKDLLILLPGKKETTGGLPPITGASARDITLDDMRYLQQQIADIVVAPLIVGTTEASYRARNRQAITLGTSEAFFTTHNLDLIAGQGLPKGAVERAQSVSVIGSDLAAELYPQQSPLGQWLRLDNRRFRVIGVFQSNSSNMGLRLNEAVLIPVASAQALFNTSGLFRLFIQSAGGQSLVRLQQRVIHLMADRHQGVEDITVLRPDALLSTFGDILLTLTLAVAGIGTISLVVAGIMMMNIMLISTHQRASEIGLLKALGADNHTVRAIFLTEAALLSLAGALLGMVCGYLLVALMAWWYPAFPLAVPLWAAVSAFCCAPLVALLFALMPASRAAQKPPVESLRGGAL
ncbi:ABC transporter permease [Corallincola spongiicola]|nr:ABC transporter permease [Corallincola spongiicola]